MSADVALRDRRAAEDSADAIKFQTYRADTLTTRWAPRYWDHRRVGHAITI